MPMAHPLKVATPFPAAAGLLVQFKVAPAGVVMASVIELVPEVVSPVESWMATAGWVAKTALLSALDGDTRKASLLAVVKIERGALVAVCRVPELAVRV